MKRAAPLALALTLLSASAHAHHSRSMFDVTRDITCKGVVIAYHWQNPHSSLVVTVPPNAEDPSTIGTWNIEASSVGVMVRSGWTRDLFKAGDPITVVVHPNRDGSRYVLLSYAIMADGRRLSRAAHSYPGETAH